MNGYFVKQDVLDLLDRIAELQEMQKGLSEKPEHMSFEEIAEQIQSCKDTIESLGYEVEELLEWIIGDVRNNEMDAATAKTEAGIWKNKQYKAEMRAKTGKDFVQYIMTKLGQKKMPAGIFNVSLVKNGGKLPIVFNVDDPSQLPAKFRKKQVIYKPDDEAIREYLDAGGKSKYFEYGERGTGLRYR